MSLRRPEFARVFFHRWINSPQIAKMPWDAQGYVWHLMCRAYADDDCAIPDDDDLLAKWAYMTREQWDSSALRCYVRGYFLPIAELPGKLANEKQRELFGADVDAMNHASLAGKAGAEKRWESRKHAADNGTALPSHIAPQCLPNGVRDAKEGRKEGRKEGITTLSPPATTEPGSFAVFWSDYPNKVGKPKALAAFRTALGKTDAPTILAGLAAWKASEQWTKDEGRFIPHPTTWLNQERWNDLPNRLATSNGGERDEYRDL